MTNPSKFWMQDFKKSMKSHGRLIPVAQQEAIREAVEKSIHRDETFLHPSAICKKNWCPKQSWYALTRGDEPEAVTNFSSLNIFAEGNAIHDKWQKWFWNAGILEGMFKCLVCDTKWWAMSPKECISCGSALLRYREVPIQNEDLHLIGHADGQIVDGKGKALIEIKSIGIGTVRFEDPDLHLRYSLGQLNETEMWKAIKTPFYSHLRQGNLYMHCTGVHEMIFIYEWKASQQVKEFSVKYQPHLIDGIVNGCKAVKSSLASGVGPDRPSWASPDQCKKCPYIKDCWNVDENSAPTVGISSNGEVSESVLNASPSIRSDSSDTGITRRVIRRSADGGV